MSADTARHDAIRRQLPGTTLAPGEYTIEGWAQLVLASIIDAPLDTPAEAHPLFAAIAAQCGLGVTVDGILELAASHAVDGPVQSSHDIEWFAPLRVGATYRITAEIISVEQKHGRKTGPFDLFTFVKSATDETGQLAARVTDVWVLPRRAG